jgi:hypothetical protein
MVLVVELDDLQEEVVRVRQRLHGIEGKVILMESLLKQMIQEKESSEVKFRWLIGLLIVFSPFVYQIADKIV